MKVKIVLTTLALIFTAQAHAKGCYNYRGEIVAIVKSYEICPPGSS